MKLGEWSAPPILRSFLSLADFLLIRSAPPSSLVRSVVEAFTRKAPAFPSTTPTSCLATRYTRLGCAAHRSCSRPLMSFPCAAPPSHRQFVVLHPILVWGAPPTVRGRQAYRPRLHRHSLPSSRLTSNLLLNSPFHPLAQDGGGLYFSSQSVVLLRDSTIAECWSEVRTACLKLEAL